MLQEKSNTQQELGVLLGELGDITNDFSHYLNFLVQRRVLIERVLGEEPASNN